MADNRAEASRLWQMMNRGGQMGDLAANPLAYAGSVVPPPNYQGSYNPAGAYAEAGRTVPNYISDDARAMNQVGLPQGGDQSDLHGWNNPYGVNAPLGGDIGNYRTGYPVDAGTPDINQGNDMWWAGAPGYDTEGVSVVPRPTMPTERIRTEQEELLSTQQGVENSDRAFSRLHTLWAQGHPFFSLDPDDTRQGYDTEGVGELPEFTEIYLQVPDEAKRYAHANKHDPKVLAQFEEKYGFPLDVSVEITGSGWEDYQTR